MFVYKKSDLDRFWAKVQVNSEDECWPWLGKADFRGYGSISINGRNRRAHQVAWEIEMGMAFPDGKVGCHSCDNPPCVNPRHIWPGTQLDNMRDAIAKGRFRTVPIYHGVETHNGKKTHCKRGHELSGDNVFANAQGSRSCATCMAIHRKNWEVRNPDRPRDPMKNRGNARRWAKENPEKVKDNAKKQREKNREKNKEYLREYYKANKAKLNEKNSLRRKQKRDQEAALEAAGVVKPTGKIVRSGFVEIPVCELQGPFREVTHADGVEGTRGRGRVR